MKNESPHLSRRIFLTKGAAIAAASSIISIETLASPVTGSKSVNTARLMTDDPVTTEATQTLTNKTIPSWQNTLGTDTVNVKEYLVSGTDITTALNAAISGLNGSGYGGRILIPHGYWTSDGGHDLNGSITIEGAGVDSNGYVGSEIRLNSGQSSFMFRVLANHQNVTLKDLSIDLRNNSGATGLLLTNHDISLKSDPIVGTNIYFTSVENVFFNAGAYGIKVDSKGTTNFECNVNRFERVKFIGCRTSFYCNSVNGGYSFDTCYFALPTADEGHSTGGTALDCVFMGNMSIEHCGFVGAQINGPWVAATDGSTILKTTGAYNNISFYDCQDENVQYAYQNTTNHYDYIPLVFRSCLIQSKLKFTANGSVILDSCRLGVPTTGATPGAIMDSSGAYVRVYLEGTNNFYTSSADAGGPIGTFVNAFSQVIYEAKDVGLPAIVSTAAASYVLNVTRGAVKVPSGTAYTVVYNNTVTPDSLVFAQLRSFDSGGAKIRDVICYSGYFQISLTQNAAADLGVAFKIEG